MRRRRKANNPQKQQGPDLSLSTTSAYVNRIIMAIMTAGGAVLKEEYGFSEEQLGEWAQKTVKEAKIYLGLTTKDEGRKTDGRGNPEA